MKYRTLYYDGCNGWCLGEIVEVEPAAENQFVIVGNDEERQTFGSRNNDGLLEDEEGQTLLVPLG